MEDWVKKIVEKERNIPLGANMLNGNYCLYRSTSRYDHTTRNAVKVSEYIRRITKNVITEKGKETRSINEYGNSAQVHSLSRDLIVRFQKHFPGRWADLFRIAMVKVMDPVPVKSVKDVLLKFSKVYKIVWEKKESLREIPTDIENIDRYLGTIVIVITIYL